MFKWGRIFALVGLLVTAAVTTAFAQSDASIRFVKPGDRRNVELGKVQVEVAVTGIESADGYTWQLLIDGVPEKKLSASETTTTIEMPEPSGPHRMTAALYNARGERVAANEILVIAAPVEDHSPVFNQSWFAPLMAVFTLVIIAIIILGLKLKPRTVV